MSAPRLIRKYRLADPKPRAAAFVAALFLLLSPAHAVPVTVGPVVISVPEGFELAQTQRLKKTLISAWTKSIRSAGMKTLLRIDVVDFGSPRDKPAAAEDLHIYAEKYLRQFLGETQRRRANYVASPVAHIKLAGLPAVRASWNGSVGGRPSVGVMYSVIVRNRYAVIFHTQDLGSTPTSGMFEAISCIESVSLADSSEAAAVTSPTPHP